MKTATLLRRKNKTPKYERGLRVSVVDRNLSDGSVVYSVQMVDRTDDRAIMLAEIDCISEKHARRLREDFVNSLLHNSIAKIIP